MERRSVYARINEILAYEPAWLDEEKPGYVIGELDEEGKPRDSDNARPWENRSPVVSPGHHTNTTNTTTNKLTSNTMTSL